MRSCRLREVVLHRKSTYFRVRSPGGMVSEVAFDPRPIPGARLFQSVWLFSIVPAQPLVSLHNNPLKIVIQPIYKGTSIYGTLILATSQAQHRLLIDLCRLSMATYHTLKRK